MSDAQGPKPARIYLDNAATSWPKCEEAILAAEAYVRECGATTGRGAYGSAMVAERWLERARGNLAKLVGATRSADVAMCSSGTHALNAALWGVVKPGDHVITTGMEHNSVLRPLKQLETSLGIEFSVVAPDSNGRVHAENVRQLIKPNTSLLAVGHASNVTGAVNEVATWGQLAQECGASLLLDASQTLGYVPIDVDALGVDILAAAGHKGLRALGGTGFLYVRQHLQASFRALMFGGTGRASESIEDIPTWPLAVEVGNLNMPGVVSMAVAAERYNVAPELIQQWQASFRRLVDGLRGFAGIRLIGLTPSEVAREIDEGVRIPVLSLDVDGWDMHDLASVLDTSFQIEVRAGWHCAALVHQPLGTTAGGGTLRVSSGHQTKKQEIDCVIDVFREILG